MESSWGATSLGCREVRETVSSSLVVLTPWPGIYARAHADAGRVAQSARRFQEPRRALTIRCLSNSRWHECVTDREARDRISGHLQASFLGVA